MMQHRQPDASLLDTLITGVKAIFDLAKEAVGLQRSDYGTLHYGGMTLSVLATGAPVHIDLPHPECIDVLFINDGIGNIRVRVPDDTHVGWAVINSGEAIGPAQVNKTTVGTFAIQSDNATAATVRVHATWNGAAV